METTPNAIIKEMNQKLSQINTDNNLQRSEKAYEIVKVSLIELNEWNVRHCFNSTEEEIQYFKYLKPKVLRELVYYSELYYIESNRPFVMDKAIVEHYLKNILQTHYHYMDRNRDFYIYYRAEKTHLDESYFTRKGASLSSSPLPPEDLVDSKMDIPSGYAYKLARIQALELLSYHIEDEINSLYGRGTDPEGKQSDEPIWTDTNVALIELAYAIQTKGSLNGGNADVKTVIEILQKAFQVKTGNYYGAFQQNIRIRKKNRTRYLDQLKTSLINYMDECDEHPRYK